MSERYIEQVLDGTALFTDIEDFVERWHHGQTVGNLHDFLGFSWEEYTLWVERPEALRLIIAARERNEPVMDFVANVDEHALMARGLDPQETQAVRQWLVATDRQPRS